MLAVADRFLCLSDQMLCFGKVGVCRVSNLSLLVCEERLCTVGVVDLSQHLLGGDVPDVPCSIECSGLHSA